MSFLRRTLAFWIGLVLVLGYWVSIRPPSSPQGYIEDLCSADMNRQMMSDNLRDFGGPRFQTDSYMAPTGASVPFMSWSMERDWLGGYIWLWNPRFPFLWVYVGASFLLAYFGVGAIVRRMGLSSRAAWGLAAFVVIFHIPRHFKLWHHFEHVPEHWVYLNLFLDAWIWQRLWRDNRWSWSLELWRVACFLATFGIAGYFWGPMTLEWVWLRICLLFLLAYRLRAGRGADRVKIEREWGRSRGWLRNTAGLALVVLAAEVALDLRWLVPLAREARQYAEIWQPISWFADLFAVFQPLWFGGLVGVFGYSMRALDWSETVVTVGWVFWVPTLFGAALLLWRRRAKGVGLVLPFFILLAVGCVYLSLQSDRGSGTDFHFALQAAVPFFKFFRVASRWGLIFPALLGALIALEWSELAGWVSSCFAPTSLPAGAPGAPLGRRVWLRRLALGTFAVSAAFEATWIVLPTHYLPPMSDQLAHLLENVKEAPGTTVLDLPFCVVGGNGVCGGPGYGQCPNYPEATAGACLREWHDKKVYGLYQARMADSHCAIYNRAPYNSWFQAWQKQRCFTDAELDDFCGYLGGHPELSSVLLYPDIWIGLRQPGCWEKIERRLGPALEQASFFTAAERGGVGIHPTRVFRFEPRCRAGASAGF